MSLSWNESLRATLCPNRVGLVRMSRGARRLLAKNTVVAEPGAEPWKAALAALGEALASKEARGAAVSVVLSNHFVRYLLVPRNDALADEAETDAHARHCFSRVYGPLADAWDIRLSAGSSGPQVASAVDRELLAGLDKIVAASGRRLVSVQPYLMTAFNRWRGELADPLVWFVLAEPGQACLAALQNGRWNQLVSLRTHVGLADRLPALLARQRILSGLDGVPGKVYVAAPDDEAETVLRQCGEKVHSLRAQRPKLPPDQAAVFDMALEG